MPTPHASVESFTGAYAVDVFISYGHIDNQANWVTDFHSALQTRLRELLGTPRVVVWRDVRLDRTGPYQDDLRRLVRDSALFVSVLTPRYVDSHSCREELDWFVSGAKGGNELRPETQLRLIRVVKTQLEKGTQPQSFNDALGYEFYEVDPQNPDRFREFGSREGMSRFDKFADRLDDLAQTVARKLRGMRKISD
jgi:hypothetical protein